MTYVNKEGIITRQMARLCALFVVSLQSRPLVVGVCEAATWVLFVFLSLLKREVQVHKLSVFYRMIVYYSDGVTQDQF